MKKSDAELLRMFKAEHGDLLDEYERCRVECLELYRELVMTMTAFLDIHDPKPNKEQLN